MKRTLLLLLITVATTLTVFSQGEIPVNMYTGSPGISINLCTVSDHDLNESIVLSYNVNAANSGSPFGTGWSLNAGGQISRQVRGLPDDFAGTGSDTRQGWLYSSNWSNVKQFHASSDQSVSTCTDEASDQANLAANNYKKDTEPDLFSYSVGGYSGKFVFGNDRRIKLIPYQDISIIPLHASLPADTVPITGWKVTTTSGITYYLNETSSITKQLIKSGKESNLTILDREYNYYKMATSYTSAWMLTKSISPTGAYLNYTYSERGDEAKSIYKQRNVLIFNTHAKNPRTVFPLMLEKITSSYKILSKVKGSSGMYATISPDVIQVYDSVRSSTSFKKFVLSYNFYGMLTSITESDGNSCLQLPPYKFEYNYWGYDAQCASSQDVWGYYNGIQNCVPVANKPSLGYSTDNGIELPISYTGSSGQALPIPTLFPTIYVYPDLPASERYRFYPIPSSRYSGTKVVLKADANRLPDEIAILSGTLKRIIYPAGGESDFTFESNKYYDSLAGKDQLGGGMRIKSITYFDGLNPAANIVKNFSYVNSTGESSGKLLSKPSFALPLWQQKTIVADSVIRQYGSLTDSAVWQDLTAVLDFDINGDDGSSVGYSHVTVSRPGNGRVEFDYSVPAAYGSRATGTTTADWSPTLMKFARPSACPIISVISKAENYGYAPFPNAEYDYERGLVWKKTEYNEAGKQVRVTRTSYQRIYKPGLTNPDSVYSLAYDRFGNSNDLIFLYGRYFQKTNVAKVLSSETVTTYNDSDTTRKLTNKTQYYYSSGNHRFVTRVEQTTPDGKVYANNYKYVPDYPYPLTDPTDVTALMIKKLRVLNRTNTLIEQWSTVKKNGVESVTGASLVKFDPFSGTNPLLKYQLAFRPSAPVASPSSPVSSRFILSDFNGSNVFTNDSRYSIVNTINEYDAFNVPVSAIGESNVAAGTLWGFKQRVPVAQFSNAQSKNIAFSDFEATTNASFAVSNAFYGVGRTGKYAVHPKAVLSRTVVKAANTTSYLLSFWLKNASGGDSVKLRVTVNGSYKDYSFKPTSSDFEYFTKSISVSSAPSTFTVQIEGQGTQPAGITSSLSVGTASAMNNNLLPMIDDIGFYPDNSTVASTTYELPFGPNSVTGPNGSTLFTTYDLVGRTKLVIDQDHNIRKRMTYNVPGEVLIDKPIASITATTQAIINTPMTFKAYRNPCISGATYSWSNTPGGNSASDTVHQYTFTSTGLQTVSLDVKKDTQTSNAFLQFNVQSTPWLIITRSEVDAKGNVTFNINDDSMGSYQWMAQGFSTGNFAGQWVPLGHNSKTFTQHYLYGTCLYVKCIVTWADGTKGESNTLTIATGVNGGCPLN